MPHRLQPTTPFRLGVVAFTVMCLGSRAMADEFEFFERRIRPVLVERCYKCHSASSHKLKGGLRLDTRAGMLKGGDSGQAAIVPGHAESSRLIAAIRHADPPLQMPPKERLPAGQVDDFVAWINSGAADPRTNLARLEAQAPKSAAAAHWAFLPPVDPPVPKVRAKSWPRTSIDHFILAGLEAKGLKPSPPADKRTLIRRATYDLTGLPPSVSEVEAFIADDSREAFAKVVDRLLASPHYGERWGRHWLDVARYADTKGYVYDREEKRFVHSHVYRDWVIRAFNDDLPYDQFLMQQVAGDLLPPASRGAAGVQPSSSPLAALGFLTVGRRFLGVQHDIIDDRIDVLTRGTMGLTVACARCHDHKYDPVPTQDYYSLYGVFSSTSEEPVPVEADALSRPEHAAFAKGLREREAKLARTFQAKRAALSDRLRAKAGDYLVAALDVAKLPNEEFYAILGTDDLNPVIVRQWDSYLFRTRAGFHPVFAPWHAYAGLREGEFATKASGIHQRFQDQSDPDRRVNALILTAFPEPPKSMREVAQAYGRVFTRVDAAWRAALTNAATNRMAAPVALDADQEPIRQILHGADSPATVPDGAIVDLEWFFDEGTRVELAKLQAEIDRWILNGSNAPPYSVVLADRPVPRNARVFLRGNPANKGEEVPRQFLQVVAGPDRRPFQHGSGRLELAQAIASRDNPLTARVMVNRVWHHHFGAGLVRTPSDFGTRAEAPSHPELLDWLALRFIDEGWSIKKLHRLIMNSVVYQQTSDGDSGARIDPGNRLLWRMNKQRLDFESMRDSLLTTSGELDLQPGGKAVDLFGKQPSLRRAVYGYIDRQFVPGVLRMFDFANPDLHIPQRSDTTVPQQALFFMNSPFLTQRARTLAGRSDGQGRAKPEDRVRRLYQMVFQREPSRQELQLAVEFVNSSSTVPPPPPPPQPLVTAWQYGYGAYDEPSQRTTNFAPLPHFTGEAWQGGSAWPDTKLGWVQLTAEGGHTGNDLQHAAIRRWVAPRDGTYAITGTVRHEEQPGDGVTARLVSSRNGLLGSWTVHNKKADTTVERTALQKGDILDFLVDYRANLNSDMFKWAPIIRRLGDATAEVTEWSAKREFGGPPPPPVPPLSPWEKYAQVLLFSNEFLFID